MGGLLSKLRKTRRRFPDSTDGGSAMVAIVERAGGSHDRAESGVAFTTDLKAKGGRRGEKKPIPPDARTIRAMAAVGHAQRAKILTKLLEGPATYRALQRLTRLKAGPLYHHVGELRLAGLILPKQRDLYELTRGGRNLILGVCALGKLVHDRRRRPIPPAKP